MAIKRILSPILEKIQGFSAYRKIGGIMSPDIRILEANDRDMITVREWYGNRSENQGQNPNTVNLVAKSDGKLVGHVQLLKILEKNHPYCGYWLFSLYVKPIFRGMGIGRKLCQAIIKWAAKEGAEEMGLLVRIDDNRAIRLYQGLGFQISSKPSLKLLLENDVTVIGYQRTSMSLRLSGH